MQFALDKDWDVYLGGDGNIAVLGAKSGGDLLCQRIRHRLQTFRGECFLDRDVGVPYFEEVFKKNPDLGRIRSLLASVISGVEGVAKILTLDILFNRATREFSVTFRAQAVDGTIAEGSL